MISVSKATLLYVLTGILMIETAAVTLLGFFVSEARQDLARLEAQGASHGTALQDVQSTLAIAVSLNDELRIALEEEKENRAVIAEENAELGAQLTTLESNIAQQRAEAESEDITGLISRWSGRAARLTCTFEGGTIVSRGSAVAALFEGTPKFLTNRHVVYKEGEKPESCTATMGEKEIEVGGAAIALDDDADVGYLSVAFAEAFGTKLLEPLSVCTAVPSIGDKAVMLGYPSIGSKTTITATEGIISGLEDDFFITSAKIDRGNSGGLAIHVKDDCFLGLPTLVAVGQVESLARILRADKIF